MTERRPVPAPMPPSPSSPGWDIRGVTEALDATPEPRIDAVLGQGVAFRLGAPPAVDLELYEQARTVRMTGSDLQIALFDQDGPRIAPAGIVFALHGTPRERSFAVTANGEVSLVLASPATMPQEASVITDRAIALPSPAGALHGDRMTPNEPFPSPLPDVEPGDRERVRLAGRLGTDPRFRETRNGVLIGSFPLGITRDDGSTAWEQVVAFRERAERLRGEGGPMKGDYVEVVGYRHRREQPNKEGTKTKVIEEVYAVVVKPR